MKYGSSKQNSIVECALYSMSNKLTLGTIKGDLDEKDWIIIHLIQSSARVSFAEIGRRAGLSPPAAAERLRRLEDAGIVLGYHARINPAHLGLGMLALSQRRDLANGESTTFDQSGSITFEHPKSWLRDAASLISRLLHAA
jgi:DNA-binding Lrp family transcriptional regulator